MVKEVFTYIWGFNEERNTVFLKFVGGTDAREHEELRDSECATTDNNLFIKVALKGFDLRSVRHP